VGQAVGQAVGHVGQAVVEGRRRRVAISSLPQYTHLYEELLPDEELFPAPSAAAPGPPPAAGGGWEKGWREGWRGGWREGGRDTGSSSTSNAGAQEHQREGGREGGEK